MSEDQYDDAGIDEYSDLDGVCPECQGDGLDKWSDYLLPCPLCQGEQTP